MTRISDERLEELIAGHEAFKKNGDTNWNFATDEEELLILRELRAYRKEGWVLVPKEPTEAMRMAGFTTDAFRTSGLIEQKDFEPAAVYDAMLAAAPEPQEDSRD